MGIGKAVRTGAATHNGEEAVLGAALMLAGENSRLVAKRVAAKLKEIQTKLPAGVQIIPVYDRTELVDRTIRTVETNLFEGAILVVVVLLVMLGNWRAALIVALAIPLSLLFAMTGMVQGRVSGNLMSLGAIDFGLIIDGAVVMVENIIRHLAEKQHKLGRRLTATERAHEVLVVREGSRQPDVLRRGHHHGRLFPDSRAHRHRGENVQADGDHRHLRAGRRAGAGAHAHAGALLVSARRQHQGGRQLPRASWRRRSTRPLLELLAPRPLARDRRGGRACSRWPAFVFTRLGAEFVPQLDEGSFATHMIRTTSIGLDASIEMQKRGEKLLLEKFPEVAYIFTRIGTAEIATDPMGVNVADTYIMFKPLERVAEGERQTHHQGRTRRR